MEYYDASVLARQTMNNHGLGHWIFAFDRAKRRAGLCNSRHRTISLSENYVSRNDKEEILDTILHEIAHALVGPGKGHNNEWKAMCIKIGAKPIRCYNSDQVNMPKGHWRAICNGCKKEFHCHRKPKYSFGYYCRKCGKVNGALSYSRV